MTVEPGRLARQLLAEADSLGGLGLDDREQGDDKGHQKDCELS